MKSPLSVALRNGERVRVRGGNESDAGQACPVLPGTDREQERIVTGECGPGAEVFLRG